MNKIATSKFYKRTISQLDSLVMFMQLRRREFYEQLREGWEVQVDGQRRVGLPRSVKRYGQTVLRSSLLLGVTYVEAYLSDVLREVLRHRPSIMAQRRKEVDWQTVIRARSYKKLLELLIDRELSEFTRKSTEDMIGYLTTRLVLNGPDQDDMRVLKEASLVRNLVTHNNAIADSELAQANGEYVAGNEIVLSAAKVHEYGTAGRSLLKLLDGQIVAKFFQRRR